MTMPRDPIALNQLMGLPNQAAGEEEDAFYTWTDFEVDLSIHGLFSQWR